MTIFSTFINTNLYPGGTVPLRVLESFLEPWVARYRDRCVLHVKSGGAYRVVGFHIQESDMTVHFTYAPWNNGNIVFSRPVTELVDGRFRAEHLLVNPG